MLKAQSDHLSDVKAGRTAFVPEMFLSSIWQAIMPIVSTVGQQAAIQLFQLVIDRLKAAPKTS